MQIRRTRLPVVLVAACLVCLAGCAPHDADSDVSMAASAQTTQPWPWEAHPPDTPAGSPSAPTPSAPSPTETQPATSTPTSTPTPSAEPSPTETSEPTEPADEPDGPAAMEHEVIELTNAERRADGCDQELHLDKRLREAARSHSADMAERDYFDHTTPEGDEPGERARDAGYDSWSGENIALGYSTAEDVVEGWMDSDGHRKNILNCDFRAIGVGAADSSRGMYWTQMFGYE